MGSYVFWPWCRGVGGGVYSQSVPMIGFGEDRVSQQVLSHDIPVSLQSLQSID